MARRRGPHDRILIAPDKFRGTLTAGQAADAIAAGVSRAAVGSLEKCPVADGGEGTLEALLSNLGGELVECTVSGPLGRPVAAAWGLLGNKTACVEMARASGLALVAVPERDPWSATSYGTGELIAAAIDAGAGTVIVGVGGSATTDGGRGALEALGARFRRDSVDLAEVRRRLHGVRLVVACDVQNPLLGPQGSARVFGPQKGADRATVTRLERRLACIARLAKATTGHDPANEPMAGAAGGLAGGLWALAGAELQPGAELVLRAVGFPRKLERARAVVTGEGSLDAQTLKGKAVATVATFARQAGVPCHAVVGRNRLTEFDRRLLGLECVIEAPARSRRSARQAVARAARKLADSALRP